MKNGRKKNVNVRASKTALNKLMKDLNRATKDLITAGMDLSSLLVPKAAGHVHKRLASFAKRVDRISSAYSKVR